MHTRVSQQFWQQIVAMVQLAQRSDHYIICEKKPCCLVILRITVYYLYVLCFMFSVCMFNCQDQFSPGNVEKTYTNSSFQDVDLLNS